MVLLLKEESGSYGDVKENSWLHIIKVILVFSAMLD